jgi:hypothetical protein
MTQGGGQGDTARRGGTNIVSTIATTEPGLRPEVYGALSLSEYHRGLSLGLGGKSDWGRKGSRRRRTVQIQRKHRAKAQKLAERAARLVNGGPSPCGS